MYRLPSVTQQTRNQVSQTLKFMLFHKAVILMLESQHTRVWSWKEAETLCNPSPLFRDEETEFQIKHPNDLFYSTK